MFTRPRVWWHSANKRCTDQNSIFYGCRMTWKLGIGIRWYLIQLHLNKKWNCLLTSLKERIPHHPILTSVAYTVAASFSLSLPPKLFHAHQFWPFTICHIVLNSLQLGNSIFRLSGSSVAGWVRGLLYAEPTSWEHKVDNFFPSNCRMYRSIYIVIFSPPAAPSNLKPEMISIVWEAETPFQCSLAWAINSLLSLLLPFYQLLAETNVLNAFNLQEFGSECESYCTLVC